MRLLISLVFPFLLFANGQLLNLSINQNTTASVENNNINQTSMQYNKMISALIDAYNMGDKAKSYIIGNAYLQKHSLQDKVIQPNNKKALFWFHKGFNDGYGLNALELALHEYIPQNKLYTALDVLDKGIHAKYIDFNGKASLALAYGGLVVDKLHDEAKYVRRAIDILYPIVIQKSISALDYTFANLLNLNNQPNKANKFLNSACNNPQVPKAIWNMCISGTEITATNSQTGEKIRRDKQTNCPVKKLMPGYPN